MNTTVENWFVGDEINQSEVSFMSLTASWWNRLIHYKSTLIWLRICTSIYSAIYSCVRHWPIVLHHWLLIYYSKLFKYIETSFDQTPIQKGEINLLSNHRETFLLSIFPKMIEKPLYLSLSSLLRNRSMLDYIHVSIYKYKATSCVMLGWI